VPAVKGSGTWQIAILAALDGIPRELRELTSEITGGAPTKSEYNSIHRAAHRLAELGLVKITRVPRRKGGGRGLPRARLLKIGTWLTDSDGAVAADAEMSHAAWLDQCWLAFGTDLSYAEEIAGAAVKLLSDTELARDRGRLRG
jgi:hypothetical protein